MKIQTPEDSGHGWHVFLDGVELETKYVVSADDVAGEVIVHCRSESGGYIIDGVGDDRYVRRKTLIGHVTLSKDGDTAKAKKWR